VYALSVALSLHFMLCVHGAIEITHCCINNKA
jgi:hypothetical protein